MRRLFSTFARGSPGAGLLLLRVVGGATVAARALVCLDDGSSVLTAGLAVLAGALLVAGLWTPLAASVVALLGVWSASTRADDPLASVLLATIGAALALVGPGAWSVDARLFGWKRVDVPPRKR